MILYDIKRSLRAIVLTKFDTAIGLTSIAFISRSAVPSFTILKVVIKEFPI